MNATQCRYHHRQDLATCKTPLNALCHADIITLDSKINTIHVSKKGNPDV